MASEIIVNTIKAPTTGVNANKVIIPSGVTLDASNGLTPPSGYIINSGSYNTGHGSNAALTTTSTAWQTLKINGTDQAAFGAVSKDPNSNDVIIFNKKYNNSQLSITANFPTYNQNGGAGHGIRLQYYKAGGTASLVDILTDGPANGWGWHGYGGNTSAMNNFTWNTYDSSSVRSDLLNYTGDVHFYIEVKNWNSADTIYYNSYTGYPKYGTIQIQEIAQ